jgi:hypothetical protein
MAGLLE